MTVPHLHICPCRAEPDPTRQERGEPRWCFKCRKRLAGTWDFMVEPPGSYYDPFWRYRCDGCRGDYRFFPGCDPGGDPY